ncbi:MAG: hypothetical protein QUV05_20365 [Phycisphaerae bacterium]|nr:hypothetical protein [Phycisphaerae bacterium]
MTAIKAITITVAAVILGLCPAVAQADYYTSALASRGSSITSADVALVGQRMGATRAGRLQQFYGAYQNQLSDGKQDAIDQQAFQLAVWEILYEGDSSYSLLEGDLSVLTGGSTEVINRANTWLAGSWQTGNAVGHLADLQVPPNGSSGEDPDPIDQGPGVTIVPVPGAASLGLLGFSLIGWAKRRLA